MKKYFAKGALCTLLIAAMVAAGLTACSKGGNENGQTSAADESGSEAPKEAAKVDPEEVMLTIEGKDDVKAIEVFYYYYYLKTSFENYYGIKDWGAELSQGYTYGDYLKQNVENQVLLLEFLDSNKDEYKVSLTDEDKTSIKENAAQFLKDIPEEVTALYGFTESNLEQLFEKLSLSDKVYQAMQEKMISELSEDELKDCQYRKVQHILISTQLKDTGETNEGGETKDTAAEAEAYKQEQLKVAEDVLKKAKESEDFEALAKEYTADGGVEYSINSKGQTLDGATMVEEFTKAATALKDGEISDIVETQFGYHIIKCVTENDESATEQAKQNAATAKMQSLYSTWLNDQKYEFKDAWKNYVVVNSEAAPAETGETADTQNESESTGTNESESK